jgi:predicted amidophosphoribosyltransferase
MPDALRGALRACRGAWGHAARMALEIALPTLCLACREPVAGEGVCAACWAKLSFIAPPSCPRLGIPFVYDPGPGLLSMQAIAAPRAYQRCRAAVRYDNVARTLVHALKYQDRTDLASAMGRWMARAGQELLNQADALVPVPLHWRRSWSRRYNQSRAVARVIQRQSRVPVNGATRSNGSGRPGSRSACPDPSGKPMYKASARLRRTEGRRFEAAASSWSTMS